MKRYAITWEELKDVCSLGYHPNYCCDDENESIGDIGKGIRLSDCRESLCPILKGKEVVEEKPFDGYDIACVPCDFLEAATKEKRCGQGERHNFKFCGRIIKEGSP